MSRTYSVQFNAVAVTAQQDFFEITAAAGKNLKILSVVIGQTSDAKDAEEELLSILFKAGQTTSGSGGSAPTPIPISVTNAAAGFVAETNNTTKASAGTIVTHHADVWNVRAPYLWLPPENMQIELTGSRRFTVELATTPADSITCNGTIYIEEFG